MLREGSGGERSERVAATLRQRAQFEGGSSRCVELGNVRSSRSYSDQVGCGGGVGGGSLGILWWPICCMVVCGCCASSLSASFFGGGPGLLGGGRAAAILSCRSLIRANWQAGSVWIIC